jgi:hypothetical protein
MIMNSNPQISSPRPVIPEHLIRERAYFLWLEQGAPHGADGEHWFTAQEELLAAGGSGAKNPPHPTDATEHFSIRQTVADHLSDPTHRFHAPGGSHDGRLDIVAGEARQRVRGRRLGGSLRAKQK